MANIVLNTNTRGLFELRTPFVASATLEYTVGAVRTFDEIRAGNINVLDLVYTPVGLGATELAQDQKAGASIITLLSKTASPIYVPSTYIARYPETDYVPYSRLLVAANIGPLPDSYDTALLEQAVADAISGYVGLEPDVKIARLATTGVVTTQESVVQEQARDARIRYRETAYADKLRLEEQLTQAQEQIQMYQQLLIDNGIVSEQP